MSFTNTTPKTAALITQTKTTQTMTPSSDGWQLDGDENHYCPQHWHLTCSKCGKTAMGNHDELIENGWDCATDEWLCPECH